MHTGSRYIVHTLQGPPVPTEGPISPVWALTPLFRCAPWLSHRHLMTEEDATLVYTKDELERIGELYLERVAPDTVRYVQKMNMKPKPTTPQRSKSKTRNQKERRDASSDGWRVAAGSHTSKKERGRSVRTKEQTPRRERKKGPSSQKKVEEETPEWASVDVSDAGNFDFTQCVLDRDRAESTSKPSLPTESKFAFAKEDAPRAASRTHAATSVTSPTKTASRFAFAAEEPKLSRFGFALEQDSASSHTTQPLPVPAVASHPQQGPPSGAPPAQGRPVDVKHLFDMYKQTPAAGQARPVPSQRQPQPHIHPSRPGPYHAYLQHYAPPTGSAARPSGPASAPASGRVNLGQMFSGSYATAPPMPRSGALSAHELEQKRKGK